MKKKIVAISRRQKLLEKRMNIFYILPYFYLNFFFLLLSFRLDIFFHSICKEGHFCMACTMYGHCIDVYMALWHYVKKIELTEECQENHLW